MTPEGLVVRGEEIELDILVWASGFSLGGGADSLGQYIVRGRNGLSISEKFKEEGYASLHGAITRDFPNFFFPGPWQAGATANQVHMIDLVCEHTIHLIRSAEEFSSSLQWQQKNNGRPEWQGQLRPQLLSRDEDWDT